MLIFNLKKIDLFLKEAKEQNIDLIRLITPTTDKERLKTILNNASGFLYYVTITGITGQNPANVKELELSITIWSESNLPIVAGFGIKNRKDVKKYKCIYRWSCCRFKYC